MKKAAAILSLAVLFSCSNNNKEAAGETNAAATEKASEMTAGATEATAPAAEAGHKKYDIKSGIITYESNSEMYGTKMKARKVLYFDDYGTKECEEEYKIEGGKETLESRNFVKDGYRYICSMSYKSGSKTKALGYGVATPFNMSEAETQKDKQFKKLGDETVCGKPCNCFSMVTPSGKITMSGWNKITLKTLLDNAEMKMKSEVVATKIEENAAIPADKFEVPADVKITDM